MQEILDALKSFDFKAFLDKIVEFINKFLVSTY